MSKHTPGPWEIKEADTSIGAEWYRILGHGERGMVDVAETPYRHEGNARLIAAAPDLLAAAKTLLDVLANEREDLPSSDAVGDARDALRAAIAKAEGKS